MASCVEAGPGSRLHAEIASSNSCASSQQRLSTQRRRSSAMCAGGPPNPMQPIRPHSRAAGSRAGRSPPSAHGGEELAAGALPEERRRLPVREACFAELAVGLEARQQEERDERVALPQAWCEPP